ncbi:MAG: hypothetical protein IPH05_06875 [Flavobacteriales bacterium]|nr:hypothetical protein [Flavobacteriales bacterium]
MTGFLDWFERHKLGVIGTLTLHSMLLFGFSLRRIRTTPTEGERSEMRVEVVQQEEAEEMIQRSSIRSWSLPKRPMPPATSLRTVRLLLLASATCRACGK